MKRVKLSLLALAAIMGLGTAYATSAGVKLAAGKFRANLQTVSGQQRIYLESNITGQTEGDQFECDPGTICYVDLTAQATVHTDPNNGQQYVIPGATGVTSSPGTYVAMP